MLTTWVGQALYRWRQRQGIHPGRHEGYVDLSVELVLTWLDAPDNMNLVGAAYLPDRGALRLTVSHPAFPELAEGESPRSVEPALHEIDGKGYADWPYVDRPA